MMLKMMLKMKYDFENERINVELMLSQSSTKINLKNEHIDSTLIQCCGHLFHIGQLQIVRFVIIASLSV